ncbi:MAG: histidinol-phosphate transaminase [Bacteroidia bacterium]|nr:histidinol-phosphate transaminase [Bacteroidia bacterium]MCX7651805.1 histidinol-phosphate transaminase [Bacteroidia bacterium]MDW8417093.1 histidinol-phosphate transaminase [Bacteroidia bacterium]
MRRFRPHLIDIPPYTSARDEYTGTAKVFLDANENAFATEWAAPYHRYPDPHHAELRTALGRYLGISPDTIMCGAGSDELIDWLLRATCEPGKDELLTVAPTYGVYATYARIHGISVREIELEADFSLPIESLLRASGPNTRLAILCRPNNPTGTLWPIHVVRAFIERFKGWVVLDEAYIDFSEEPAGWLPHRTAGTILLRTFSKAWGMAGWRIGYAIADPEVVSLFYRTKLPYNLSGPAQAAAVSALQNMASIQQSIELVRKERFLLSEALKNLPIVKEVFPSQANFLLVRFHRAKAIYTALAERGIIVRYRGTLPLCEDTLRITIGTPEENRELITALHELSQEYLSNIQQREITD